MRAPKQHVHPPAADPRVRARPGAVQFCTGLQNTENTGIPAFQQRPERRCSGSSLQNTEKAGRSAGDAVTLQCLSFIQTSKVNDELQMTAKQGHACRCARARSSAWPSTLGATRDAVADAPCRRRMPAVAAHDGTWQCCQAASTGWRRGWKLRRGSAVCACAVLW